MAKTKKGKKKNFLSIPQWAIPWVFLGVLIIIAGIMLLPTKTVGYTVLVPYIDTEEYTVEVPYEDIEEYVERVPYETTEEYVESIPVEEQQQYLDEECSYQDLTYNVEWETCKSGSFFSNGQATISVSNTDSKGGTFSFKVGYVKGGVLFGSLVSKFINGGRTETFTLIFTESTIDNCRYEIGSIPQKQSCELIQKTKTVTTYKDVIKTKTVTKYRDETKYKKVTNTRTEIREKEVEKERTEEGQKKVNWLFGFDAII